MIGHVLGLMIFFRKYRFSDFTLSNLNPFNKIIRKICWDIGHKPQQEIMFFGSIVDKAVIALYLVTVPILLLTTVKVSLSNGPFSSDWKGALVKLHLKNHGMEFVNNLRPVSNLQYRVYIYPIYLKEVLRSKFRNTTVMIHWPIYAVCIKTVS